VTQRPEQSRLPLSGMIAELQRRNFAETTIRTYVPGVEHFSRYFHRGPDQLGPEHIRKCRAMLFLRLKVPWNFC
jgi:integrase/recombinase XerD